MNPEKNDVDISQLFNWGKVFVLEGNNDKEDVLVYMKVLGDADVNRTRVYALRKSAELRKELSNPDSDIRWATIKNIEALSVDDIINYIILFSMREISRNAVREVKIPVPKMPKSNSSQARMEKYQLELDAYDEKRRDAVNKFIQKEIEKLKKQLSTESKEDLYRTYVNTLIDEFCEREALRAYSDMETYMGCWKDDTYTERFFPNFEAFDNLEERQKSEFKAAFSSLNVGIEDLKKLREVTP